MSNGQKKHDNTAKDIPYAPFTIADMHWNKTGSWRYLRPQYVERIPPCQASCPTGNDIERWIKLYDEGEVQKACEILLTENPFPSITGRACFHPCREGCNRKELGGAVTINLLERMLADSITDDKIPKPFRKSTKRRIAIVGSGPASLACAYHLSRLGHKVTIIEKEKEIGGMMRYGIPSYRLPREILNNEVARLEKMGVEFELNRKIKKEEIPSLRKNYDAVFLATGAWKDKKLGLPFEDEELGVIPALKFLHSIEAGEKPNIGKNMLIIGGGNTAIDAARTSLRLGAKKIVIIYRRTETEMPAFIEEVEDAKEEGIEIETLVSPKQILIEEGSVVGMICNRMKLGEEDETGRKRPISIEGSECRFEADTILTAIGEDVENGVLDTDSFGRTKDKKIFAGGDMTKQSRTIVDAIASGKRAAIAIDCNLLGYDTSDIFKRISIPQTNIPRMAYYIEIISKRFPFPISNKAALREESVVNFEDLNPYYFELSRPTKYPKISIDERMKSKDKFEEIQQAVAKEIIDYELARCVHCGRCTECDNCFIYCPDISVEKKQKGYDINYDYCKGCGVCAVECPRGSIRTIIEEA